MRSFVASPTRPVALRVAPQSQPFAVEMVVVVFVLREIFVAKEKIVAHLAVRVVKVARVVCCRTICVVRLVVVPKARYVAQTMNSALPLSMNASSQ
jgi:hypothetical protein